MDASAVIYASVDEFRRHYRVPICVDERKNTLSRLGSFAKSSEPLSKVRHSRQMSNYMGT